MSRARWTNERCPLCGARVVVDNAGLLVCSLIGCPDPTYVHRALSAVVDQERDLVTQQYHLQVVEAQGAEIAALRQRLAEAVAA